MCGPKFCSMQLSHELRDAADAGMQAKSAEFVAAGGELYVDAAP